MKLLKPRIIIPIIAIFLMTATLAVFPLENSLREFHPGILVFCFVEPQL